MNEPEGSGIHVQSAMEWLLGVLLLGKGLTKPPMPESDDPQYFRGGSPNMKGLFCLCWWVYESLAGRGNGVGRQRLLNWLKLERMCHGHGEIFSATHGQLWAGIFAGALLHALRVSDEDVKELTVDWWRFELLAYNCCEFEGEPWLPGGRAFKGGEAKGGEALGSYPTRGKVLLAVRGIGIGKVNQYDLGAHCLARLPESIRAQIQQRPDTIPPTWTPWHAARYSDGSFYSFFEEPRWKDAVLAAGVLRGERWIIKSGDEISTMLDRYEQFAKAVVQIDTPQSEVPRIEVERQNRKPNRNRREKPNA